MIFENRIHSYKALVDWANHYMRVYKKSHVLFGVEATGDYYYLMAMNYGHVLVNPMHVIKSKELDNSPTKHNTKDAKVIKDGRYSVPNLLEGIYPESREGAKLKNQLVK